MPRIDKGSSEQKVHDTATETHTFVFTMFEVLFLALRCLVEPITVSKTCLVVTIHCIGSCLRFLVEFQIKMITDLFNFLIKSFQTYKGSSIIKSDAF